MPSRYESSIENRLIKECAENGKITIKGAFSIKGFPDRIVFNLKHGEIHWLEIKNDTYYKQTPTQKTWQKIIEKCGGKYFLINSSEEMDEYIKNYITGEPREE